MAIRARSDNLSLDIPTGVDAAAAPAPVSDFADVWAQREALRQACVRMIGDPARAEDLVQDTFMSALKYRGRLHEGQPVAPWLKTVARRRSIDELRGRDRVALMAEPPEPIGLAVEDPADHVVSQELVGQLRQAIAELSVRERQLLLRQASYGLSLAELAAEEDTSIASVRSVLARARQKLRLSLERGGVFGALPLPRYLSTLRERLFRWGSQLEPALPAVTGAGARFSEAIAAVITAIALFLSGGGLPSFGGSTVVTGGLVSADEPARRGSGSTASFGHAIDEGSGGGGGTTTARPRPTAPGATPLVPVPPVLDDPPTFPNDGATPDGLGVLDFAASDDGQAILMSGLSGTSSRHTIFRSLDAGQTWARLTDDSIGHGQRHYSFIGSALTVAPTYPVDPRVYAISPHGVVMRSEDGGLSFEPIVGARGDIALAPDFGAGDDRVFLAGPPPAVYRDGDPVLEPLAPHAASHQAGGIAVAPDYATTGAVLIGGSVAKGTTLVGTVATCSATGCIPRAEIPGAGGAVKLHTSKTSPGTVFAWRVDRLFRSTDSGYTFSQVTFPNGFHFIGLSEDDDQVLVHGTNYSGQAAPMYSTADGGATWSPVGAESAMDEKVYTAIPLGNGKIMAAASGGGAWCSTDNGQTWARRCPS